MSPPRAIPNTVPEAAYLPLVRWPFFLVHVGRHRPVEVFREIQPHQVRMCRYLTLERLHVQSARTHALLHAQGWICGNVGGDPARDVKVPASLRRHGI